MAHHRAAHAHRPALGGLHAGWASFGTLIDETVAAGTVRGWLRRLVSRLSRSPHRHERIRDMPAYLLDDIGLDPRDAVSEPDASENDAAMWVGIKTGMHPRP